MYDELIGELHLVASGVQSKRRRELLEKAADAIEELQEDRVCRIVEHDGVTELSVVSRWIPVTERLPQEYEDVLCYYEYFRYGDHNCMFRAIDRGYYVGGIWGGEAGQGLKNKVLYWMPLPEPPKEDA